MSQTRESAVKPLGFSAANKTVRVRTNSSTYTLHTESKPRQCYTRQLLEELGTALDILEHHKSQDFTHALCVSDDEHVFNYGGDLDFFVEAIESRDRLGLYAYGMACIDLVYRWSTGVGHNVITVTVVEGDALGGGFESALAANVLVAERGTHFGFPEIMFNLFPGMGAYHLIENKLNAATAKKMILSGERFTAEKLFDMGLVDILAEKGEGRAEAHAYIQKSKKRINGELGLQRAVWGDDRVSRQDLEKTVDQWTYSAMNISKRNLRLMKRLVSKQTSKAS